MPKWLQLTFAFASISALSSLLACGDEGPDPLADWPDQAVVFEAEVLLLMNERRGEGAVCGDEPFEPTHPLAVDEALERASRLHSYDMDERGYFSHTSPGGVGPAERIANQGFTGSSWGENIAGGPRTPESVMESWMSSTGHCKNIMNPAFAFTGVGYYERHWTLTFGGSR